jgi:hypothetical protein
MIDYALPSNFAGPVEIAIYDQGGALVNRFFSSETPKPVDFSKLAVAPEWVVNAKPPAATPGQHRFIWNLHYSKPAQLGEGRGSGVWAPPGRYIVELRAGGQVLREPLTVLADPRVKATQADFDAQFRLARQIEAARVRVHAMLQEASPLKASLGRSSSANAASLSELDALVGSPAAVEGISAPTSLNAISQWLDKLSSAVEGADGAPTPDEIRGFAIVSAALDSLEPRWRSFAASARARAPAAQ